MRNSKKDVMLHAMGNSEFFGTYFSIISIEMYSYNRVTSSSR
jgi:hypothetical protein